jgi:hypothetical protein
MRFYRRIEMAAHKNHKATQSTRAWISGLAVTLTVAVAYLAFWTLWPVATFVIGCLSLIGLVVAGYILGAETSRSRAKSPRRQNDRDS